MARHNYVNCIAFVSSQPKFKDGNDGEIGVVELTTIMGEREQLKAKTGYQLNSVVFMVKSTDPKIVEVMKDLEIFDVVDVTGFIATYDIIKKTTCPFCEAKNRRIDACLNVKERDEKHGGNEIYIYPISLSFRTHFDSTEEVYKYLRSRTEDVNRVMLLGNLTGHPIQGELDGGRRQYTRFQVAINRKFFAKDGADVHHREDYPWIYSYGDKSLKDFESLERGALVFVDGALQSRKYKETYICQNCGQEYVAGGRTLEVLSYDTEYLRLPSYVGDIEELNNN